MTRCYELIFCHGSVCGATTSVSNVAKTLDSHGRCVSNTELINPNNAAVDLPTQHSITYFNICKSALLPFTLQRC